MNPMITHLIEDTYPLSPLQQGMLFHLLGSPASRANIVQVVYTVEGEIEWSRFENAWQSVALRHPILRTTFLWEELDKPIQVVQSSVQILVEEHDWTEYGAEQQILLSRFLEADRKKGFDLSTAPLMRVALLKIGGGEYYCVWSYHHRILTGGLPRLC